MERSWKYLRKNRNGMQKNIYVIAVLVIIVLGIIGVFASKKFFTPQKTHYHAGFIVFENNKKLDFSDNKYMYIEPCSLNDKSNDSPVDIQIEKAHLHENIGDLVHIEGSGAKWVDLFTNIHFPIDYAKTTGFINGKEAVDYQLQSIHPFDSLVVFIGNNNPNLLYQAVTKNYIEKMAKKSTTCGD